MTATGWQRIVQKYGAAINAHEEVMVILKSTSVPLRGVIKEIETDFLVLETKSGHLAALVVLSEVAALQTYHGQW